MYIQAAIQTSGCIPGRLGVPGTTTPLHERNFVYSRYLGLLLSLPSVLSKVTTDENDSAVYKRGKSNPIVGTNHASDLVEFYDEDGTADDFIGVDAIGGSC